ncbi:MAG TPA: S-layer homology domain-containing protein, partial [Clostridia bacterium]|nr:S-layer homology domain-containing protein [Clostridia bacterium]
STLPKEDNISRTSVFIEVTNDKDISTDAYNDYATVSDEYFSYVEKAVEQYILTGDQNNNLRPNDEVTKAEFLAMLIRASELEVAGKYRKKYIDITAGHWFNGYAQTVFKYGLAAHEKGYLNPNAHITSDIAQYALSKAFESQVSLDEKQKTVFADGLSREEAIYLIFSYMEAIGR